MALNIQIYSIIFSLLFGVIFYFLLDNFNKIKFRKNLIFKIIASLLFVFIIAFLYFIGLLYINNGYVHIYFLISILVGYMFVYFFK